MNWHIKNAAETAQNLGVDIKSGLSAENAQRRLEHYGKNIIAPRQNRTLYQCFLGQLGAFLPVVVLSAAAVSIVVAVNDVDGNWLEPLMAVLLVIATALVSAMIEKNTLSCEERLRTIAPAMVRVLREGERSMIPSEQLVPGDIILLREGDLIPADCRLAECSELICDESTLTGEKSPVRKDAAAEPDVTSPLKERTNMLFAGCSIISGKATAIVTETAAATQAGLITPLPADDDNAETETGSQLRTASRYFAGAGLIAALVIFVFGFAFRHPNNLKAIEVFLTAVTLALVTIPEGIPGLVNSVFTRGALDMALRRAVVHRLNAIEKLECVSVLCTGKEEATDPSGMTVAEVWTPENKLSRIPEDIKLPSVKLLLELAAVCGNIPENNVILAALDSIEVKHTHLEAKFPRVVEFQAYRYGGLTTSVRRDGNRTIIIVKGAPDVLFARCDGVDAQRLSVVCSQMCATGLHVTAVAKREMPVGAADSFTRDQAENGLTFLGLLGITNPPCQGSEQCNELCETAGITRIMMTGDNSATADAVAHASGILHSGDESVTGSRLSAMSDNELENSIRKYTVLSEVSPAQKLRVTGMWQQSAEFVAVTGKYVSDTALLRCSDVALAMGENATGSACGVADVTILDGTLTAAVSAISWSRSVCAGVRRCVRFCLSGSLGTLLAVACALIITQTSGLRSLQLLLTQLLAGFLPALALGLEPDNGSESTRPPHRYTSPLFSKSFTRSVVLQSLMLAGLTVTALAIGNADSVESGRTLAFGVLTISRITLAVCSRCDQLLIHSDILHCRNLLSACLISLAVTLLIMLLPTSIFMLTPLSGMQWLVLVLLSLSPLLLVELAKLIYTFIGKYFNTAGE